MIWEQDKVFCLSGKDYSYAFCVHNGKLVHTYYGEKLQAINALGEMEKALTAVETPIQWEYAEFGRGDFSVPAVVVCSKKTMTTDFRYVSHEILQEKPRFGMPALRDGETLVVRLQDEVQNLQLNLYYSVYAEGLTRRAELVNLGEDTVIIEKLASFCLDLPRGDYETIDLCGHQNGERVYQREKVCFGIKTIASARGISSHQHNPFLAVMEKGADEDNGGVYALNLVYSGSFEMEYESEELSKLRVNAGMKIMYGGIPLVPGESFSSPEAVCVYSSEGLGEMSRKFHRLYRKHLLNPRFVDEIRPIVLNSWESIVFNISEQTLCELVDGAKDLGINMLVLDDGWFGCRDNDDRSLGDWYVHKNKLPNGLTPIVEYCKENGMKFGLWFEPEAVNPDSDLFRAHPDWAILTEGREGVQFRNQYVLNLGIPEALDYVFERMCAILESADIAYVKWDMNRSFTDARDAVTY
ncbi:MAG: alpha-galactosidase, partial [Clostridia bacterium]|nr:alpha-galactosidase [Clostridia bacterium]